MVPAPRGPQSWTMTQTAHPTRSKPTHPRHNEAAFFTWVRRLGVPRLHGWLGGVCAGIAARIGIDPLVVRGMFVVAALLWPPTLIVYAVAWALLPSTDGHIILQRLGRGRFEPALIAILIMMALGLLSGIALWWVGIAFAPPSAYYLWEPLRYGPLSFLAVVLIAVAAVALAAWLVARAVRRARRRSPHANDTAMGPRELEPAAVVDDVGVIEVGAAAPLEPTVATDATDLEFAQWRAAHTQWRADHNAWRQQQADAEAAAREIARDEREASARAFAAEAAEHRRIRRATKPRASVVFVLAALGAALIAGAVTALAVAEPLVGAAAGILTAGTVSAAGMVVAGALRRRSGFLAFLTALFVACGVLTAAAVCVPDLRWGSTAIAAIGTEEQHYLQPFGETTIHVFGVSDDSFEAAPIVVRKGTGDTTIYVTAGSTLDLRATLDDGTVDYAYVASGSDESQPLTSGDVAAQPGPGDARVYVDSFESPGTNPERVTTVPVRIDQRSGSIHVVIETLTEE